MCKERSEVMTTNHQEIVSQAKNQGRNLASCPDFTRIVNELEVFHNYSRCTSMAYTLLAYYNETTKDDYLHDSYLH